MYIPQRAAKAAITAKLEAARAELEQQREAVRGLLDAANAYKRKNFDRSFLKASEPHMRVGARVSMEPWYHGGHTVTVYGGTVHYDSREVFYGIGGIEQLREEATKRIAGIEEGMLNVANDLADLDLILNAYDKAEAALRDLDALMKCSYHYREELPLTSTR